MKNVCESSGRKSGEWTISRKMTRQKEQEEQAEKQERRQERGIKWQPWDSRQGINIRHPQPAFRAKATLVATDLRAGPHQAADQLQRKWSRRRGRGRGGHEEGRGCGRSRSGSGPCPTCSLEIPCSIQFMGKMRTPRTLLGKRGGGSGWGGGGGRGGGKIKVRVRPMSYLQLGGSLQHPVHDEVEDPAHIAQEVCVCVCVWEGGGSKSKVRVRPMSYLQLGGSLQHPVHRESEDPADVAGGVLVLPFLWDLLNQLPLHGVRVAAGQHPFQDVVHAFHLVLKQKEDQLYNKAIKGLLFPGADQTPPTPPGGCVTSYIYISPSLIIIVMGTLST